MGMLSERRPTCDHLDLHPEPPSHPYLAVTSRVDRARAEVLFEAAEQAGCVAHLALITLWQLGDVDHDYSNYSYRRRRRYGSRYDDDHDDDSGREYEMGEIIDTSLSASHWSDRHGNARRFGEMAVDDDEIVTGDALDDAEPSEEEFEDYTGNAGMTLERWYHRAAVVIWPRERHFAVLCGAGTQAAIGGLEAMVKGLRRGSKEQREATRRDGLQFAGAIIDGWKSTDNRWYGNEDDKADRSVFSKLLCKLDDPELMRRFLSEIVPNDGSAELHREFAKLCRRHGLSAFEAELAQAIDAASEATLLRNAQLLHLLCRQPEHDKGDAAVCTRLCERAVAALERFDGQAPKDAWRFRTLDRTALLVTLVSAMLEIAAQRPLRKVIDHTLAHREQYDLTDTHLTAIFKLASRLGTPSPPDKAIAHWLSACRRELQMRTARAPQPPGDYRRDAGLSCKCADCRVLSRFLANPNERECRMPLNKDRRRHLHGIIEANRCDVTHVTERKGRPSFKMRRRRLNPNSARASKRGAPHLKNMIQAGIDVKLKALSAMGDEMPMYASETRLVGLAVTRVQTGPRAASGYTDDHTQHLNSLERQWGQFLLKPYVSQGTGVPGTLTDRVPVYDRQNTQNVGRRDIHTQFQKLTATLKARMEKL